jgi:hypothetical protein
MPSWPAKDPHAVKDYSYAVPLDEGDSVASMTFEKLSGDVTIDSDNAAAATDELVATLSGGTDGETAVFRVFWVTVGGREDDAVITQFVSANEPVVFTATTLPRPADLIARFPAFAAVAPATIADWITDAQSIVTTSWAESDYRPAIMELAAHNMVKAGIAGITTGTVGDIAGKGVTSFKSASFSVDLESSAAKRLSGTGYASTQYGADFAARLGRNVGGPRLVGCVTYPGYGYVC